MLEDRGAWVRVQDDDGLTGWAERSQLERTAERERRLARYEAIRKLPALAGVVTERTPLYAGPGIFYPIIGELPARRRSRSTRAITISTRSITDNQIAYADIDAVDVTARDRTQLNVATSSEAPTATDTTASAATTTTSEQPAQTAPMPPPPEPPHHVSRPMRSIAPASTPLCPPAARSRRKSTASFRAIR